MAGSDSGKVIEPGNAGGSLLLTLIKHEDQPAMPQKADKLPDSEIDLIRKWIDSGSPENSGSVVAKKMNDLPDEFVAADEKPSGPPPMPHDLLLEPFVRTPRAGAVPALAASPWSPLVAVAGQKQILLYHTKTLDIEGVLAFPEGFPASLKFDRSGKLLLAAGGVGAKSGRVVVWNVETGERVAEVGDEFDAALAADISADHSRIALGGPNKLVKIFDAKNGKLLYKIKKHTDWITAMSLTSDGKLLVTGDRAGGLAVWDASGREMFTLTGAKGAITAVSCFENMAATASEDGTIRLWNLKEGNQIKSWNAHKDGVTSVSFARDGRLVSSGRDKLAKVWDKSGKLLRASEPLTDVALCAALCDDRFIAADWSGAVRVWNVADGKRIGDLASNPPTLAERLDAATKRFAELKPSCERQAIENAKAEENMKRTAEEMRAASDAVGEKEKRVKSMEAQLAMLAKTFTETNATLQKSRDEFAQLQKTGESSAQNSSQAAAGNDTEIRERKEIVSTNENDDALNAAQDSLNEKIADADKIRVDIDGANKSLGQAKAELEAANKALQPKVAKAKAAADDFAKTKSKATQAEQQLAAAHAEIAQWTAAQLNVTLYAARKIFADRKSDYDKTVKAARAASAELDKARGDLAAAEKALAEAPERIKARANAVAQAKRTIETAHAAVAAAAARVSEKETLAQLGSDFSEKLKAESAKLPDDKMLADAAEKAKASFDLLNGDLAKAREAVEARNADLKRAGGDFVAGEQALMQGKRALEIGPDVLKNLRESVDEITSRTAAGREAADKLVEQAAKPLKEAKARVDALAADYDNLRGQAVALKN